jgi:hypothetical protein
MDPDCAICHAPAALACECEAKGLEVAVRQAEARMMQSIYNDIRSGPFFFHSRGRHVDFLAVHGCGLTPKTTSSSTSDF